MERLVLDTGVSDDEAYTGDFVPASKDIVRNASQTFPNLKWLALHHMFSVHVSDTEV
jgi:hypothetical protein